MKYSISTAIYLIITLIIMLVVTTERVHAATYTIDGYSFSLTHCNSYTCKTLTSAEAKTILYTALQSIGSAGQSYSFRQACGNVNTLTLTGCKSSIKCSADGSKVVKRSSNCKVTKTDCPYGCANGACKPCSGSQCPSNNGGGGGGNNDGNGDGTVDTNISTCTEDVYDNCTYSACIQVNSTSGQRTRSCRLAFDCPNVNTPNPSGTESCSFVIPSCTYYESDGTCITPTVDLKVVPSFVGKGGACHLSWSTANAEGCEITIDGTKYTNKVSSGISTGALQETTTYRLTCTNGQITASDDVACKVGSVDDF